MNRYLWVFVALFAMAAFLMTGCAKKDDDSVTDWGGDGLCDACRDAAPNPDDLQVRIPGDDQNQVRTKGLGDIGDMAVYYDFTVDMSRSLNYWILGMLGSLDEILSYPPSSHEGDYCVWGPFTDPYTPPTSVEILFKMRQASEDTFDYYWQERPKNSDDEWTDIWSGDIVPSTTTARRGIGTLAIDFTKAQQLDPTWDVTGQMDVDYDTFTDDARSIDITFIDFAATDYDIPMDATYHYYNAANDDGDFQFTVYINFNNDVDYPELESYAYHTQWVGSGSGAATVTVSGGDIDQTPPFNPPLERIVGYECWNDQFEETYFEQKAYLENGDIIDLAEPVGDIETCVF